MADFSDASLHHAHAATTAAAGGLDDHRVADLTGDLGVGHDVVGSGPSEPGTDGTPAAFIARIASTLSPIRRMVSAFGPMKMKPDFSTCSAKSAFSDRKP